MKSGIYMNTREVTDMSKWARTLVLILLTDLKKYNREFPEPKVLADRIDAHPRSLLLFSNLPGNEIKVHKARDCFMIRDDNHPFRDSGTGDQESGTGN